jgi:hypothetical protein
VKLYCKELYAKYIRRTYSSLVGRFIREQYGKIERRIARQCKRGVERAEHMLISEKIGWVNRREQELGGQGKGVVLAEWRGRWLQEQTSIPSWPESVAAHSRPNYKSLRLYDRLRKAESSVFFQARTGRIGLQQFLASAKVPGIKSGEYLYRQGLETTEHTILAYTDQPQRRWEPRYPVRAAGIRSRDRSSNRQTTNPKQEARLV